MMRFAYILQHFGYLLLLACPIALSTGSSSLFHILVVPCIGMAIILASSALSLSIQECSVRKRVGALAMMMVTLVFLVLFTSMLGVADRDGVERLWTSHPVLLIMFVLATIAGIDEYGQQLRIDGEKHGFRDGSNGTASLILLWKYALRNGDHKHEPPTDFDSMPSDKLKQTGRMIFGLAAFFIVLTFVLCYLMGRAAIASTEFQLLVPLTTISMALFLYCRHLYGLSQYQLGYTANLNEGMELTKRRLAREASLMDDPEDNEMQQPISHIHQDGSDTIIIFKRKPTS